MKEPQPYKRMTLQAAVELAAPHTWPASVAPVGLGTVLALNLAYAFDPWILLSTLCAAVLLQCAVNALNDYADFVKGTDTLENSDDPTDAALVYHGFHPRCALILGGVFLLLAAACGAYTVVRSGWIPLVIGLIGGVVVLLYSLGHLPISYLPLGEFFSGFVMGGLIPLACFTAQTGRFSWRVLWYALPCVLAIGLIMMVNNTCDVERDKEAGRRTLPVLLGRRRAAVLLKALAVCAVLLAAHLAFWDFRGGFPLVPVLAIAAALPLSRLAALPLTPQVRGPAMGTILKVHTTINFIFIVMITTDFVREVV